MADAARLGRLAARSPEARAKHVASRRQHAQACSAWDPSTQPEWLTARFYTDEIQPRLVRLSGVTIASRIGVSRSYAGQIRLMSIYFALGIFLPIAVRNPAAHRSLIAFAA